MNLIKIRTYYLLISKIVTTLLKTLIKLWQNTGASKEIAILTTEVLERISKKIIKLCVDVISVINPLRG